MSTKITKSNDKMISGVAAGIAEYIDIDPVWVRLGAALAILSNPPLGLIIYAIMAIIMPDSKTKQEAVANPFNDEEIIIQDGIKTGM